MGFLGCMKFIKAHRRIHMQAHTLPYLVTCKTSSDTVALVVIQVFCSLSLTCVLIQSSKTLFLWKNQGFLLQGFVGQRTLLKHIDTPSARAVHE